MVNAIGIGLIFVMMLTGFRYTGYGFRVFPDSHQRWFSLSAISLYFIIAWMIYLAFYSFIYLAGSIMIDGGIAQRIG